MQIDGNGTYEAILAISDGNQGLSFADSSVLELAIRKEASIISSDKSLRNESTRRNIPVRGMLWIIEELVEKGVIKKEQAINCLNKYPEVNKRTPKNEVERLISKFLNE